MLDAFTAGLSESATFLRIGLFDLNLIWSCRWIEGGDGDGDHRMIAERWQTRSCYL